MSPASRKNKKITGFAYSPGRMEALSDGVIAIVATILVLLLEVPETIKSEAQIIELLVNKFHVYIAFVISFFIIGIYWWTHHIIFHFIDKTDRTFAILNLLFLFFVALVPFPTDMITALTATGEEEISTLIYGSVQIGVIVSLLLMWGHAKRRKLIRNGTSDLTIKRVSRMLSISLGIYLVSLIIALISPIFDLFIFLAVPVFIFIYETNLSKVEKAGEEHDNEENKK